MKVGFTLPQFGGQAAQGAQIGRFAGAAEELGASGLWVADRLLVPVAPAAGYAGGAGFPPVFRRALDPLVVLAAAAVATTSIRLGTNVLSAPWYPPALLARTALSLDVISGGRFVLGLGVGWCAEEFAAVGVPPAERGDRLDECLEVLHQWWTAEPVQHTGKVSEIPPAHVDLKPHGIPLYLGAFSGRGLRRLTRWGAGWLPVVAAGQSLERVTRHWDALGRVPAVLRIAVPEGTSLDTISETLDAAAGAGFEEAFVELVHVADDVDAALDMVAAVLRRSA